MCHRHHAVAHVFAHGGRPARSTTTRAIVRSREHRRGQTETTIVSRNSRRPFEQSRDRLPFASRIDVKGE